MAADVIDFMRSLFLPAARSLQEPHWRPAADVYLVPDGYLVKFDLAGVRPEDIELTVTGSRLTVRGARRDWCVSEACNHYRMEIAYSRFERTIELPDDLEHPQLDIEYRHGMLLVRLRRGPS
jgi:HSP20 family protein